MVDLERLGNDRYGAGDRDDGRRASGPGQALRLPRPAGLFGARDGRSQAGRAGRRRGPPRGRIVQACILSLDPVTQELDDAFRLVFAENVAEDRDPESGEALLNAQGDAPEPLTGNMLDVGEIVAEQLSLAADPYPRRPGVKLEDVLPKPKGGARRAGPEQRRHPFAGLAALRDKPRRGR